jgi:uncharacterized protein
MSSADRLVGPESDRTRSAKSIMGATNAETYSVLWHRLDMPGLDTCLFCRRDTGWEINGIAKFCHEGVDSQLRYRLDCDSEWRTCSGSVSGYTGTREINTSIERRTNAFWAVDSQGISGLEACAHLDFSFTPATNFPQIRTLALKTDQSAYLSVAWLDMPLTRLQILEQLYDRCERVRGN